MLPHTTFLGLVLAFRGIGDQKERKLSGLVTEHQLEEHESWDLTGMWYYYMAQQQRHAYHNASTAKAGRRKHALW